MSKQITFGKYNGYTAKEVAICDAQYAMWAADNMKSDFWRKEFNQALKDAKNATIQEVVSATVGDDAPEYAKEIVRKDALLATSRKDRENEIITKFAQSAGVSVDKFSSLIKSMKINGTEPEDLVPAKFTSVSRYEAVRDCLSAIYSI